MIKEEKEGNKDKKRRKEGGREKGRKKKEGRKERTMGSKEEMEGGLEGPTA